MMHSDPSSEARRGGIAAEVTFPVGGRRFLAAVLPQLLNELACQQASLLERSNPEPTLDSATRFHVHAHTIELRRRSRSQPSAVVVAESNDPSWDAATRLDAVNAAARERGVRPRQTIAEASALAGNLKVLVLQRERICAALKQIADVALGFGSPVSFDQLDTVWVDISGSSHLFGSERHLATQLAASIRALGYEVRAAVAEGPWVAAALARHADIDESAVLVVPSNETARSVATLPILALPLGSETVTWFAQLGLLFVDDLRKLPSASLAARLPSGRQPNADVRYRSPLDANGASIPGIELGSVFDLIRGEDDSVLIPYHPEETPSEESCWDDPLSDVEPLLFVCKGLAGRLGARLEGRGQAAQALLLTIQYDRSIAALQSAASGREIVPIHEVHFELATPLSHAEDIERVVRSRLQREVLAAPATGLSLRATSVTRAQSWQQGLCTAFGLGSDIVPEARSMAVLVAELAADVGSNAVGLLTTEDSHLLEKSSRLTAVGSITSSQASDLHVPVSRDPLANAIAPPGLTMPYESIDMGVASLRLPTRLLTDPLELTGSIDVDEVWMLGQQPFVVKDVRFEERLEAIEWWENERIERDYFRIWLTSIDRIQRAREGIEVLAYHDRESGKSYVQAVYD